MARRASSRRGSARPKRRKLSTLVSSLRDTAASAVRRAARVAKGKSPRPPTAAPAQPGRSSKPPLPPLTRTSVVKKPARRPSFRASRPPASAKPAARTAGSTPAQRRSVVRKPSRGPTVQRAVKKFAERRRQPRVAGTPSARPKGTRASRFAAPGTLVPAEAPRRQAAATPPMTGGGAPLAADPEPSFSIPTGYGDDHIVLMVKDPWWIYAYWEIQQGTERAARAQLLPHEAADLKTVLRVYDVTGVDFPAQSAHRSVDIALSGLAMSWYIETNAPGRSFIVEIGLLANNGRFILLARSNRVTAPRFGPSEIIDEAWMTTDEQFWQLFGAAAGFGAGSSRSAALNLSPHQLLSSGWSSSGLYGLQKPPTVRGFWCRVNTDVVIHGATEPKSTVTVQGHPVEVRKDGTFGLRLTLPEGSQTVGIEVTSPDGRRSQAMMPVFAFAWSGALAPQAQAQERA